MVEKGIYRVLIDGRWSLRDLYDFPHAFMQVYAFAYCLDSELEARDSARIDHALESYPWGGGYSIVNIYTVLQNQVEQRDRPEVASIQYASPGWIDLLLNLTPVLQVAGAITALAGSLTAAAKCYLTLQKLLSEIRLQSRKHEIAEAQVAAQYVRELRELSQELANYIGVQRIAELEKRTQSPLVLAKLLAAEFRRRKVLADFVVQGKAFLPPDSRDEG